jgi:alpha-1,2-mannosyltransferase
MGYALTFPFVRLIGGPSVTIGAYVHYPTVSTDMVKRVKARTAGIEDGGAAKSRLRTQIKLMYVSSTSLADSRYYKIFTSLYATSLLFSEEVMTNSSWTQAHITDLLNKGRNSFLASLLLMDDRTREIRAKNGEIDPKAGCRVAFPPCDTEGLQGLGKLGDRKRELVSLAQFRYVPLLFPESKAYDRPEKEQAKQVQALAILFKDHPEYRSGDKRISLTMMGGTRNAEDKERAEGLKQLASELGVAVGPILILS